MLRLSLQIKLGKNKLNLEQVSKNLSIAKQLNGQKQGQGDNSATIVAGKYGRFRVICKDDSRLNFEDRLPIKTALTSETPTQNLLITQKYYNHLKSNNLCCFQNPHKPNFPQSFTINSNPQILHQLSLTLLQDDENLSSMLQTTGGNLRQQKFMSPEKLSKILPVKYRKFLENERLEEMLRLFETDNSSSRGISDSFISDSAETSPINSSLNSKFSVSFPNYLKSTKNQHFPIQQSEIYQNFTTQFPEISHQFPIQFITDLVKFDWQQKVLQDENLELGNWDGSLAVDSHVPQNVIYVNLDSTASNCYFLKIDSQISTKQLKIPNFVRKECEKFIDSIGLNDLLRECKTAAAQVENQPEEEEDQAAESEAESLSDESETSSAPIDSFGQDLLGDLGIGLAENSNLASENSQQTQDQTTQQIQTEISHFLSTQQKQKSLVRKIKKYHAQRRNNPEIDLSQTRQEVRQFIEYFDQPSPSSGSAISMKSPANQMKIEFLESQIEKIRNYFSLLYVVSVSETIFSESLKPGDTRTKILLDGRNSASCYLLKQLSSKLKHSAGQNHNRPLQKCYQFLADNQFGSCLPVSILDLVENSEFENLALKKILRQKNFANSAKFPNSEKDKTQKIQNLENYEKFYQENFPILLDFRDTETQFQKIYEIFPPEIITQKYLAAVNKKLGFHKLNFSKNSVKKFVIPATNQKIVVDASESASKKTTNERRKSSTESLLNLDLGLKGQSLLKLKNQQN